MKHGLLFLCLLGGTCGWLAEARAEDGSFSSAREAFRYLHKVATHPRCVNCHGIELELEPGRTVHIPTVGEQRRPHPMNVTSRLPSLGMNCTGCHQRRNLDDEGTPPGSANNLMPNFLWHMPHRSMIINPNESERELCEQWLDRDRNGKEVDRGGRNDMARFRREFLHHVEADPLIHWAFAPGGNRQPAPGSLPMLIAAMNKWLGAGAPCP